MIIIYKNVHHRLYLCIIYIIISAIQLTIVFVSLAYGGKLAWGVRKASSEFNESSSLMFTIGVMSILYII